MTTTPSAGRPGPSVYRADGTLADPYHLLDTPRPPAASRLYAAWQERELESASLQRERRQDILAAAAQLDPADVSDDAEGLRAVAAQQSDHADADAKRIEWAAAALQADPGLAERMNPAVVQYARELLTQQTAQETAQADAAPGSLADDAGEPVAGHAETGSAHDAAEDYAAGWD